MLSDILAELASELGYSLSDSNTRSYLLTRVNDAARTFYDSNDMDGCWFEQIFEIEKDQQLISMPYYVDKVDKVRHYNWRWPIDQVDYRPRYNFEPWVPPFLQWRRRELSPLKRNISNAGQLTLTFSEALTENCSVTLQGETQAAKRKTEIVSFLAGETTKQTSSVFLSMEGGFIKKSIKTNSDLTITDIDAVELSEIPNMLFEAKYQILQVLDRFQEWAENPFVECLYKMRFVPFEEDTDEFVAGNRYDKVIYWATLADIYAKMNGMEEKALLAKQASRNLASGINDNAQNTTKNDLVFAPNPLLGMVQRGVPYRWRAFPARVG